MNQNDRTTTTTIYEGDVVEDSGGLLWLVRNDGLRRRGDWKPKTAADR